jgi:phosphoribosyl 1,2-cyclic phosphodiesterase
VLRFASLGSGSQGNSLIVDAGDTKILLDCGFSTRATIERLARLGVAPEEVDAIVITHEHSDHIAGVFRFARRFAIPVYLTHGTHLAAPRGKSPLPECRLIDSDVSLAIGGIEIRPFPVPHDAREPVQYVFSNGAHRLGVLTDSGSITQHIIDSLKICDALVLECNHDQTLLAQSAYPMMLKRRIAGDFGHLDNDQAALLLRRIETGQLQHIVAAHLSEHNNRPELAARALAAELNCSDDWIGVACQQRGFAWRELR